MSGKSPGLEARLVAEILSRGPMPFDRFLVFLNSGGYEPNRLISQPASAPSFTPRIVSAS